MPFGRISTSFGDGANGHAGSASTSALNPGYPSHRWKRYTNDAVYRRPKHKIGIDCDFVLILAANALVLLLSLASASLAVWLICRSLPALGF